MASPQPKKLPSAIMAELRPLFPAYSALLIFSFFTPVLYLVTPVFLLQVSERVMVARSETTLVVLLVITLLVLVVYGALEYIRGKALLRLGAVIDTKLTNAVFAALHNRNRTASSATLADMTTVREFLSGGMIVALFDALWSPLFILVMFFVHWVFGVTALVLVLLATGLSLINHFLIGTANRNAFTCRVASNTLGEAIFRNSEVVRTLGMLPGVQDRWYGLHRAALGWQLRAQTISNTISSTLKFLRVSQIVIVYAVGAFLSLESQVTPGALLIAVIVMLKTIGPIDYLVYNWQQFTSFRNSFTRLDELLTREKAASQPLSLPRPTGALEVSRLIGAAPGADKIILNDVSFQIGPGRILGVVGHSGAGKSCLARFVSGAWHASRGTISLDGHLLSHWKPDELGRYIGYMPQDLELLPGTVADNIGRFDKTLETDTSALLRAVDVAGLQDLLRELPDGLSTPVGAGGHVLSGGQRQRIAIARAFYGDPHLIVLDEPTSNLDAAGEQALGQALQRHKDNNGIAVVVTHKLSLLSWCDDVLVLHAGTVQAFGTRSQIVERLTPTRAHPILSVVDGGTNGASDIRRNP